MKKKSSQPSKKFSPIRLFLLFIVAAILVVLTWSWYVHYQEKQKFMTLKQDILSLQAEFNKIDPGWEFIEGCKSKGEKFKQNEASSCYVQLEIPMKVDIQKYKPILNDNFIPLREYDFKDQYNNNHTLNLGHKIYLDVGCGIGASIYEDQDKSFISCHDSALDFYSRRQYPDRQVGAACPSLDRLAAPVVITLS